jgi:hypothetical protein
MLFDNDDHKSNVSRHGAFERASSGVLLAYASGLQPMTQISSTQAAT